MPTKKKQPTHRIRKSPKNDEELRTIAVCTRLDSAEAAKLDVLRGSLQRGVYLRMLLNGTVPPKMPAINIQAYNVLRDISHQLDNVSNSRAFDAIEILDVKSLISKLRLELLNIKLE